MLLIPGGEIEGLVREVGAMQMQMQMPMQIAGGKESSCSLLAFAHVHYSNHQTVELTL